MATHTIELIAAGNASTGAAAPVDQGGIVLGPLAVRWQRLRGGLREGLLLVELVAGTTQVFILPDRGMGIWSIVSDTVRLGWQSPLQGPVHPRFVPLSEPSGLGWLDGFDELVARCGLVSNGAPDFSGNGRLLHGLHGRIANLPAHHLEVTLDDSAGTIRLTGIVDETRFLFHSLRMTTQLTLHVDRSRVSWVDTVENRSDRPTSMQMLYHINFGPPLLGAGAELVAQIEELAPRDARAVSDVPAWQSFAAAQAGRLEQVHFAKLRADRDGWASALLVAADAENAAGVSWRADTLPYFALWKNQGGAADGYVTGLEPATNFPNPRSFEESQNRVVHLLPQSSVRFEVAIEHFRGPLVAKERKRINASAGSPGPLIHPQPRVGWSPPA